MFFHWPPELPPVTLVGPATAGEVAVESASAKARRQRHRGDLQIFSLAATTDLLGEVNVGQFGLEISLPGLRLR